MTLQRVLCVVLSLAALSAAHAQRPNRLLIPLQAYTLTEYVAVAYEDAIAMPEAHQGESYAGVAFNSRGNLVVFSRGPIPFLEFTADGRFLRAFGAEGLVRRAHGLQIMPDDTMWITDVADHQVMKVDPDGNVLLTLGTKGQNGEWDERAGRQLFDQPNDVAVDSSGNVYVAQGHGPGEPRVLKFGPDGGFITQWGSRGYAPGEFTVAHAIEVDANDIVHVADRENMRIHRYDTSGNFLGEWRYEAMVCAMYLHEDGHLYITTGFDGQFAKLDLDGTVIGDIGRPGPGNGAFGEAPALTLDRDGNAYISDVILRKIQKFAKLQ
jgi:sugar lactone lactonase YvrE